MFIDEQGVEKPFKWRSMSKLSQTAGHAVYDIAWTERLDVQEWEITDEVVHLSLKKELVEHISEKWGLTSNS